MSYEVYENSGQKEALINEFKGNLFEYLVGHSLACEFDVEPSFVKSFGGELKRQLVGYQKWLMENDNTAYCALPILAKKTAERLSHLLPKKISNILIVGKSAAGSHDMRLKEADLIILSKEGEIPVGLKLCKEGSFVNTKSGGVRSFFSTYFAPQFSKSFVHPYEKELGDLVDKSFLQMGTELYERDGLTFSGQFCREWDEKGHSHLPGQLPSTHKDILRSHYHRIIVKMYEIFCFLEKADRQKFLRSLYPILGMGDENLIQMTCFHGREKGRSYQLKELHTADIGDLDRGLQTLEIIEPKKKLSSFEIKLQEMILQIRVKPMNKFTVPALKVNCSVKK